MVLSYFMFKNTDIFKSHAVPINIDNLNLRGKPYHMWVYTFFCLVLIICYVIFFVIVRPLAVMCQACRGLYAEEFDVVQKTDNFFMKCSYDTLRTEYFATNDELA